MEGDKSDKIGDDTKKKSYAGIPEAAFVDDVDAFMALEENGGDVDKVLRRLDEQHSKYKFMEYNLASKRRRLKSQIPDLENSLDMIKLLQKQSDSPKEIETQFLLSEQVYVKARVPPTDKVCLWLGHTERRVWPLLPSQLMLIDLYPWCHPPYHRPHLWSNGQCVWPRNQMAQANVMLEYTLEDAMNLLVKNIDTAKKNLGYVEHDLDFLRQVILKQIKLKLQEVVLLDQFTTTEVNMARVYNWDVKKRQAAKSSS
ncbi:hypothetical protein ANN_12295 [Periplaneta americana]|uniref:Prefoldin subunit 3 n=1 Tax=Periplaneta americana TaxID=6978 RepID=A0ABQ8TH62_PERAM|nr:hypothetical protein ANN_12295 [Periplaneta americana]